MDIEKFFVRHRGGVNTTLSLSEKTGFISLLTWMSLTCVWLPSSQAASFDCEKAQTEAERFICASPTVSKLDDNLAKTYQEILAKANDEQKQRLVTEQRHWLKHTRSTCKTEPCFKHAYWSRLAEVATFFEPRSPLYKNESDKAEEIKRVLATAPLYESSLSDPPLCRQILADLKQMKDIRFVDPIVQTMSYEDPALDEWKQQCTSGRPFTFSYECEKHISPEDDIDTGLAQCYAGYGLPPFKIFELPPLSPSDKKRFIFYTDDGYGPMNKDWKEPAPDGSFSGFQEFKLPECKPKATYARASNGLRWGSNYNSIFIYRRQYYFLVLNHQYTSSYWLTINPIGNSKSCDWSPVNPHSSESGRK